MFPFDCKTQNAADHARDHPFLVRRNDAHGDPAGFCGNYSLIRQVRLFFELDDEKSQSVADPGADYGRVFSDAASKHQCIYAAECSRERADPFLDLVAKQRDRFSGTPILSFTGEQVTHVGTGLGYAEQPGL